MSASKEKKTRQEDIPRDAQEREQKRRQEEQADRRRTLLYTIVVAAVAVAAACLLVWNSGLIQRNIPAVTINGEGYTASEVQYYYNSAVNEMANTYYSLMGSVPFDATVSLKNQVFSQASGESWYDQLMVQALSSMASDAALAAKAQQEGYTLSQQAQDDIAATLAELDTAWVGSYSSRAAYLRANMGPYMTYDLLVSLFERQALANEYAVSVQEGLAYSAEDYEAYYQENADFLDTYTFTQFAFQGRVETTDEEGSTIEMTEEEQAAALEEAAKAARAKADEVMEKLEAGEDPEQLAQEYEEDLLSSQVSGSRTGSSVNTYYSEWMYDAARKDGDITLAEYESDTVHNYYVVRFEGRERDETPTRNVRHILAQASDGTTEATQEQLDEAKARAEALLAQWEAGEATEDSFAALAAQSSDDAGSAASGGLISNITEDSGYVAAFKDWAMDSARKDGDVDLVQTEYGWHIMYYVSGRPSWQESADTALRSEDYTQWTEEVMTGYEAVQGFGMNFVQA